MLPLGQYLALQPIWEGLMKCSANLTAVGKNGEESEKRSVTFDAFVNAFLFKLNRLFDQRDAAEAALAQNRTALMHLRTEALKHAAELPSGAEIIRALLPDTDDPAIRLLEATITFVDALLENTADGQLQQSALFARFGQDEIATMLTINAVALRAAKVSA